MKITEHIYFWRTGQLGKPHILCGALRLGIKGETPIYEIQHNIELPLNPSSDDIKFATGEITKKIFEDFTNIKFEI